jgi:hypothetical protein
VVDALIESAPGDEEQCAHVDEVGEGHSITMATTQRAMRINPPMTMTVVRGSPIMRPR